MWKSRRVKARTLRYSAVTKPGSHGWCFPNRGLLRLERTHGQKSAGPWLPGPGVALTPGGRRGFFRSYELRMDTLVTHPLFEYRVSYRRLLEIQARLLARVLEGEIGEHPVFVTR